MSEVKQLLTQIEINSSLGSWVQGIVIEGDKTIQQYEDLLGHFHYQCQTLVQDVDILVCIELVTNLSKCPLFTKHHLELPEQAQQARSEDTNMHKKLSEDATFCLCVQDMISIFFLLFSKYGKLATGDTKVEGISYYPISHMCFSSLMYLPRIWIH